MKFKNLINPLEKDITEIDLSEKELEYISMLRLNVNIDKLRDKFSISIAEKNKLYRKFGIPEFWENKDRHILAISLINNLVPYETLKQVYEKYNLAKCKKILCEIAKAPICNAERMDKINETLIALYEKLRKSAD